MTRNLKVAGVVLIGLALLWVLVSWEPIGRHTEESSDAATQAPPNMPGPSREPASQAAPSSALAPVSPAPSPVAPMPESKPTATAPDQGPSEWPVPEPSGPTAELKQAFDSEPRSSNAISAESAIQTGFTGPAVHPALLESVLCHTTVCRVRMRWTQERALGFMAGLMHVVTDPVEGASFETSLGIDQPSEPNAAGERTIDVYLKIRSPK